MVVALSASFLSHCGEMKVNFGADVNITTLMDIIRLDPTHARSSVRQSERG